MRVCELSGFSPHDKIHFFADSIDTACVELKYSDGTMVSIDTITVENELADNLYQRSELDWLTYNKPHEYADLILNGGVEDYMKGTAEHRLTD